MKKLAVLLLIVCMAPYALAADMEKAKQEGQANLYANITAIEPIMEAFTQKYGGAGTPPPPWPPP